MFVLDLFDGMMDPKGQLPEAAREKTPEPEQQQIDVNRDAALRREREPAGSDKIDAMLAAQHQQRQEYEKSGKFWLKTKSEQKHIQGPIIGKAAANEAARQLLAQAPELRGNLLITAWGPGEQKTEVGEETKPLVSQDELNALMAPKHEQNKALPDHVLRRIEANPAMRKDIIAAWKRSNTNGVDESDVSGLLAASRLNRSFIITVQTAEGHHKKFRVKAQSERVAKEKFQQHHSQAKILSVKEEGVAEADELRARGGLAAVNKKPRTGQTDMRNIPVGNHPDARINKFTDKDRAEHPSRLKAKIKATLGKHSRPNLPEQGVAEVTGDGKFDSMIGKIASEANWVPQVVDLLKDLAISKRLQAQYKVEPGDILDLKKFIASLSAGNLDAAKDQWAMMEWNELDNALEYFVRKNGLPNVNLHELLGKQDINESVESTITDIIEYLRSDKPGLDKESFLDWMYTYLDASGGKQLADHLMSRDNDPSYDEWYANYSDLAEGKTGPGLWANIHAKRKRIKNGSGEQMRKPGSKGAPSAQNFKDAASEGVAEANIQPTSAASRSHIGNLSNPVTNSVVHPSSGKEIGLITMQPDGKYYAHPSSVKLSHNQGGTFATKDEAHQFIRNAHANAIKNGTLSDKWLKQQPLPQFAKGQGVAEGFKNTYNVGDRVDSPLGTGTIVAVSKNINVDGRVKVKLDDPSHAGEDGKYKDSFVLDTTQLTHINEQGVAEGGFKNVTAIFSGYSNYMRSRAPNVFRQLGIKVLNKEYDEDQDIIEYTVISDRDSLDKARATLETNKQFGGMILQKKMAEGVPGETPENELERLKLRQNAEHGSASLKRQVATQARIRELEKQIADKKGVAEANTPSDQPRIRKYSKIRADGSKAERFEVLDYLGRRVQGQGPEGFDDPKAAKEFFRSNYINLTNPMSEESLQTKTKKKEKEDPENANKRVLESKKRYWCSTDKRWKDASETTEGNE